jgi:hypothetical protein
VTATDLDTLSRHAAARGEAIVYTPPDGFELVRTTVLSSGPARVAVTLARTNRDGVTNRQA